MYIVGYFLALVGLFLLYENQLALGGLLFFAGGFIAQKLFISIRSSGVVLMAVSIAFGFHNEYSPWVLFLIFVGFVLACFNTSTTTNRSSGSDGWGFDIDFSSMGSDSGDCGGGDGGGGGD